MKRIDGIEWVAGIFEGEGNIYRNDKRRIFTMSVKMKDEDIIRRFHRSVGFGSIKKRKPYKGYAPMWEWTLCKTNDILKLCKILLPIMGHRRSTQIKIAIHGKAEVKEKQILKTVGKCNYMQLGELSTRGAKRHIRLGETPCTICAANQREYLRRWRRRFFEANR